MQGLFDGVMVASGVFVVGNVDWFCRSLDGAAFHTLGDSPAIRVAVRSNQRFEKFCHGGRLDGVRWTA